LAFVNKVNYSMNPNDFTSIFIQNSKIKEFSKVTFQNGRCARDRSMTS